MQGRGPRWQAVRALFELTCRRLGLGYCFKASYTKDNRTSSASYRGPGLDAGLELLEQPTPLPVSIPVAYEGYGAGGVEILIESLTDNCNRTVADVRHLFSKHGGKLGENGCVAWLFTRKGLLLIERTDDLDEDTLLELALEAWDDADPNFRPAAEARALLEELRAAG